MSSDLAWGVRMPVLRFAAQPPELFHRWASGFAAMVAAPSITVQVTTDPSASGGFGLMLAARLADTVGWYATHAGKHVWARFTVASREPSLAV